MQFNCGLLGVLMTFLRPPLTAAGPRFSYLHVFDCLLFL